MHTHTRTHVATPAVSSPSRHLQATLLLGNVDFGTADGAQVTNPDVLDRAQGLLGVSELRQNLETRSMTARGPCVCM